MIQPGSPRPFWLACRRQTLLKLAGGRNLISHFRSWSRDDIIGEIFVVLTLAAAAAVLLY